jgi:putative DNA-invertase from lambdoid prophage Rac
VSEPQRCAIWARVSTTEQHAGNQLDVLRAWAAKRGLVIAAEFITEDSAWASGKGNGKGAEFDKKRAELLAGAHRGDYSVVLVWAIDRLSRKGPEDTLAILRQLLERGAEVWSDQEPWLVTSHPAIRELLVMLFAWLAKQESDRRSERIRAGLAKRRAEGKPVGRQPGAGDRSVDKDGNLKRRKRSGYVAAWEDGGARRSAERERRDRSEPPEGDSDDA